MYESFFNLRVKPFDLVPDPKFIYLSSSHKKALTYLDYGIRERVGFILLTGEVGSGKTTLIRDLINKYNEQIVLAKIFNTLVSTEQLLSMINDDFGLPTHGKDKITLIRDLNDFLIDQYAHGNQPILIIDEAQNLALDLLEEVRMLSNLETADSKLLQIILVGQPELRANLYLPEMLQLRQRISINCHLSALSRQETENYVIHRMEVAGNATAAEFPSESLDIVYRYSKGIPRLINIICDFLMLSAFAEETKTISVEMVREVIGDLDFDKNFWAESEIKQPTDSASPLRQNEDISMYQEMHTLLLDISHRIEYMENDVSAKIQSAFKDFNDRFSLLQDTVKSHVAITDSQVLHITQRVEELAINIAKDNIPEVQDDSSDVGFIHRLFGNNKISKIKG